MASEFPSIDKTSTGFASHRRNDAVDVKVSEDGARPPNARQSTSQMKSEDRNAWDHKIIERFGAIINYATTNIAEKDEDQIRAILSNKANKKHASFGFTQEDDHILDLLKEREINGQKLLEMTKVEFFDLIQGQLTEYKTKTKDESSLRNTTAEKLWGIISEVVQAYQKAKMLMDVEKDQPEDGSGDTDWVWTGVERFNILPPDLIRIDMRRYGVYCWSVIVKQLQIHNLPLLWKLLEYLGLRLSTPVGLKLLYHYRDELSRTNPGDGNLNMVCQAVIEGSDFPIATMLMVAAYMKDLAKLDVGHADVFNGFARNYIEAACLMLAKIESDHLAAMVLEAESDIPEGPGNCMSPMDIAMKFNLQGFFADPRVSRIVGIMWREFNYMNPNTSFKIEAASLVEEVAYMWTLGPRQFFFTPFGKFAVQQYLLIIFLILFSVVTFHRRNLYAPWDTEDIILFIFITGYVLSEMYEILEDHRGYLGHWENTIDFPLVIVCGIILVLRMNEQAEWSSVTECNSYCWKFCNGEIPCDVAEVKKSETNSYYTFNFMNDDASCPADNFFKGWKETPVPWFFRGEYLNKESNTRDYMDCQVLIRGIEEDMGDHGRNWPLLFNGGDPVSCKLDATPDGPDAAYYHKDCHPFDGTKDKYYRLTWSIAIILLYIRMLQVLIITPVGALVKMFINMLGDCVNWLMFIMCLWIGFAAAMYFLVGDTVIRRFNTPMSTIIFMLKALMGDVDWEWVEPDHPWDYADKLRDNYITGLHSIGVHVGAIPNADGNDLGVNTYGGAEELQVPDWFRAKVATLLLILWAIIGVLLLVNLLIAMMASTYQQIKDHTAEELTFMKTSLVIDYDRKDADLPAPFNILVLLCLFLWLAMDHMLLLCTGCFLDIHGFLPMNDEERAPELRSKYSGNGSSSPRGDGMSSGNSSGMASPIDRPGSADGDKPGLTQQSSVLAGDDDYGGEILNEGNWLIQVEGKNKWEQVQNGISELWQGASGGWYCGFCNSWIQQGREINSLARYYLWYETTQSSLDSEDKQRVQQMQPALCPVCFRPSQPENRMKVISEILSYWIFFTFIYLPMTLTTIPFWLINKWSHYLSSGFDEVMTCDLTEDKSKSELGMPSKTELRAEFKLNDTFCQLFEKEHNIWQFVNGALGVTLILKQPQSLDFDWGFQVDRTLSVIAVNEDSYADMEGIRPGMKIVAVNGKLVLDRMHTKDFLAILTDGKCSPQNPIKVRFSGDTEGVENEKVRLTLNAGEDEDEVMDIARRLCRLYKDTEDEELKTLIDDDNQTGVMDEVGKRLKDTQERLRQIEDMFKKQSRAAGTAGGGRLRGRSIEANDGSQSAYRTTSRAKSPRSRSFKSA